MDPRRSEKSVESRGEEQSSPTREPERNRRFQIIKLEERIAPGGGHGGGHGENFTEHAASCNGRCGT